VLLLLLLDWKNQKVDTNRPEEYPHFYLKLLGMFGLYLLLFQAFLVPKNTLDHHLRLGLVTNSSLLLMAQNH